MPRPALADLLHLATDLAQRAGALALAMQDDVLAARGTVTGEQTKSSPTDVVTAADQAVEALLVAGILAARPEDGLLGEEGAATPGSSGVRWVIDPIDGTVNYLYGLPQWCVSIGIECDGLTSVGVVFDPTKGELWQAVLGAGSTLNDRPLRCSGAGELSLALVGTGFGYDVRRRAAQAVSLPDLLPRVRDLRRAGAGALDLCSVGAGRLDAYFEQGLSPWDISAGALIATEAGARVGGLRGRAASFDLVLAATPELFAPLHDLLVGYDADADPLG